jgi:hypothetical protein
MVGLLIGAALGAGGAILANAQVTCEVDGFNNFSNNADSIEDTDDGDDEETDGRC